MSRSRFRVIAALVVMASVATASLGTNGYFTHGYGTTCKGLAGACVALAQDTLVAATNPAGLAMVGRRFDAGVAVFNPNRQYTIDGGPSGFPGTFGLVPGRVESDSRYFGIPHFGANWEVGERSTFGVTVYGHGGMNTDYPTATFFASSPTGVDLSQLFLAPAYAFRLGGEGNHAIGIMPVLVFQSFEIEGVASFAPFSSDPGRLSNNGHEESFGFGLKLGYLGQWSPRFSFGVALQSEMDMEEFDAYAGLFAESGGFDIPATYWVGFAVKASSQVTVTFDVQETMYSDIKSVGLPLLPNLATSRLGDPQGAGFGWQDMTTLKLGVQIATDGPWTWRFGASAGDQPIPSSEVLFNILAPGVMEEHVTFGFTRQVGTDRALNLALMHAPSSRVLGGNPLEVPGMQSIELEMDQWELEVSYSWGF